MKVKNYKIDDLIEAEYNPRQLTKDQHKQITDSIKRFGIVDPVIVNTHKERKNIIVGGHQRTKVAKELGHTEMPCVEVNLTPDKERELNIRLNKNTGEWDWDELANHFDLSDLIDWGFDDKDLAFFDLDGMTEDGLIDDDEVPEVTEAITKEGDIWLLGEHRVLCGDSTKKEDVERLMDGNKADMVFTSPPYNGNTTMYDYVIINGKKKRKDKPLYENNESDNKTSTEYIDFLYSVMDICFLNTYGYIFWNINYNAKSRFEYLDSVYPYRKKLQETIIWKKNAIPTANGFTRNFEFIFMFKTNDEIKHLNNEYDVTQNIWDVSNIGSQQENHKACFPIGLPEKAIGLNKKTKLILDPFLGSGTTLIAAEKLNRKCYGMELDTHYCDVIVKRWEEFTGKKAVRLEEKKVNA